MLINWDMTLIIEAITQHVPLLMEILHGGAQTGCTNRVNTQKDYSTVHSDLTPCIHFLIHVSPPQAFQVMIMQLAKLHSNYSLSVMVPPQRLHIQQT